MRRLALFVCALLLPFAAAQAQVKLKAGMVTGIDQVGLPIALERGFFEKQASMYLSRGPTPPASTPSTPCRPARAKSCRSACP